MKWYIVMQYAEGKEFSVIKLSKSELDLFKKFTTCRDVISHTGGISGATIIYNEKPFNTRKEAVEYIKNMK